MTAGMVEYYTAIFTRITAITASGGPITQAMLSTLKSMITGITASYIVWLLGAFPDLEKTLNAACDGKTDDKPSNPGGGSTSGAGNGGTGGHTVGEGTKTDEPKEKTDDS